MTAYYVGACLQLCKGALRLKPAFLLRSQGGLVRGNPSLGKADDETAVVAGRVSGIGRATCLLFAREGHRVLIVDRDGRKAEQVAQEFGNVGGVAASLWEDVSSEEGAKNIISRRRTLPAPGHSGK